MTEKRNYTRIAQSTADGSPTLYLPEMDEHYHSVKGAMTESKHIFIECGTKACKKDSVNILEIGFGTGLNAFLTATLCTEKKINYYTTELYPLPLKTIEEAGYLSLDNTGTIEALHSAPWEKLHTITKNFSICKLECDLTDAKVKLPGDIDIVYFDAFAPEKQPEMWSEELFTRIFQSMSSSGILTTYCSKGVVRRMMQKIGFTVERLPGPPKGKREILRATKP